MFGNPSKKQNSPADRSKSIRLELHELESRETPATTFNLATGALEVTGTAANDHIILQRPAPLRVSVQLNGETESILVRRRDGRTETRSWIDVSSIRSVTVRGMAGDDFISVVESPTGATVQGGLGNDTIFGSNFRDLITTGDGARNSVWGLDGNDQIHGGSGRDVCFGGRGNDEIRGFGNADELYGEWGDDTLHGGDGRDYLQGGAGDADFADALFGIDVTRGVENSTRGGARLVVGGALETDVRQNSRPYCVFYSHLSGMARILSARGRNLATERIEFVGRDAAGNFRYQVSLFTSSGAPVTHIVTHNGPAPGDATAVDGEAWVTIFEKAFLAQIHAEDPTGSLWRRYWDHQTVMTMLTGGCEQVHMIDHFSATFGATLGDEHFFNIARAIRDGKLVTASTWNTPLRGVSTLLVFREHNYTVTGVNEADRTLTLRNPWGRDGGGRPSDDPNDGVIVISWADFKGSFQGYNVGRVI